MYFLAARIVTKAVTPYDELQKHLYAAKDGRETNKGFRTLNYKLITQDK